MADDPAQPLAYYRGFANDRGQQGAVLYSRKANARAPLAIQDGGVALRGHDKPTGVRKGPPRLVGERPLLLSIGAQWCKPCSEELGDVVDLARQVRGDSADDAVGLLFSLQGVPDEWPLAEVRDEFVTKHKAAKKLKQAIQIPPWAEFRADIESNWGEAVGKLGLLGGDKVSLPINLLLDRCGHVQAAASGALNEDKKQAFLRQAARLQTQACAAAPPAQLPPPRPVAPGPAKPRVDPKPGEGKTVPPIGVDPGPAKGEAGLKPPADGDKPAGERPPGNGKAPAAPKAEPGSGDKAEKPTEKGAEKAKDDKPAEPGGTPAKADKPKDDQPKDDKPAEKKSDPAHAKEATK